MPVPPPRLRQKKNISKSLEALLQEKILDFEVDALEPFRTTLLDMTRQKGRAIFAYGSCLSSITRSETSSPDFYVVTDRYRSFHASRWHAVLNWILPPSIYHFNVANRISKYCVIRESDLSREVSPRARDLYHLGRFSKRIALLWAHEEFSRPKAAGFHAQAMRTVAGMTYHLMEPDFDLDTFIRAALRISYLGDLRIEAADKIDRLFEAEAEYYRNAYAVILEEMKEKPWLLGQNASTNRYQKTRRACADRLGAWRVGWIIRKSKLRAQLRWPKGWVTVEGWVDYMLAKIARTHGIQIEMTEREKRYWFIFGWKHFLALRRRKLIK